MDHRTEYVVRFSHDDRRWLATVPVHDTDAPNQVAEHYLGNTAVDALIGLLRLLSRRDAEVEQMARDLYTGYGRPSWDLCSNQQYWYERARKLIDAGWLLGKMR